MGDEEDRARLMKMTEFEREQVLADRQTKREEWKQKSSNPCPILLIFRLFAFNET